MKWIRNNMSLSAISTVAERNVTLLNSGDAVLDCKKYAIRFFDAAELAIHSLHDNSLLMYDVSKKDTWYFAIVYLYRHSLELLLKACIFSVITDVQSQIDAIASVSHDLKECFDLLEQYNGITTASYSEIDWLKKFLTDISRIDRESDMFRYPFGNNMQTLFMCQKSISY